MKMRIFYIAFIFLLASARVATAQMNACDCDINVILDVVASDSCCYDIKVSFSGGRCAGLNYNTINIALPTGGSETISSIQGVTSPIATTVTSHLSKTATLSSTASLTSQLLGQYITVGQICLNGATTSVVNPTIEITGSTVPASCVSKNTYPAVVTSSCRAVPCGGISASDIGCSSLKPYEYSFSLTITNTSGIPGNTGCTVSITSTNGTIIGTPVTNWSGNIATVTGVITGAPTNPNYNLSVVLTCTAPGGIPVVCNFSRTLVKPCCDAVTVGNQSICKSAPSVTIPLIGCSSLQNVQTVTWYVVPSPCPAPPPAGGPTSAAWGTPYQSGAGCNDLVLIPGQWSGNVCVIAEVQYGAGACKKIYSNVATITFCEDPILLTTTTNFDYCSNTTNTNPLLQVNVANNTAGCISTVQWFRIPAAGVPIPVSTGIQYQTTGLTYGGANTFSTNNCLSEYKFRARVTNLCGFKEQDYTIKIYNVNSNPGQLVMDPVEPLPPLPAPICPGEDLRLRYIPGCTGPTDKWTWYSGPNPQTSIPTWTPIPGGGNMNTLFNTNRLYNYISYMVRVTNGVCPADDVPIFIDVRDQLTIVSFTAAPTPNCNSTSVLLTTTVSPSPLPNCTYNVFWYKDGGNLIHTSANITTTTATFSYNTLPLDGNYYVIVKSKCCSEIVKSNVITIKPTCVPVITGPCFICLNQSTITLTGVMVIPPNDPCPDACTYQWYEVINGVPTVIVGANNITYMPSAAGTFIFESTCNGCIQQSKPFVVTRCSGIVSTKQPNFKGWNVTIVPNPTMDKVTVAISPAPLKNGMIQIVDLNGRVLLSEKIPDNQYKHTLYFAPLPGGLYFVRIFEDGVLVWVDKVVRSK